MLKVLLGAMVNDDEIKNAKCLTKRTASKQEMNDLEIAYKVASLTKSNCVVYVKESAMKDIETDLDLSEELAIHTVEDNTSSFNVLEKMSIALNDVVQNINGASDSEQEMAHQIQNVVSQTDQIKGVLAMIKDIADQTNLLALNAAIEAARAGEHVSIKCSCQSF